MQLSTTNYKARGRISVLSDKEMKIYTVESITEADYGCEESGRKEPMALLKLIADALDPEEKYVEVSEKILANQKTESGPFYTYIFILSDFSY